MDRVYSVEEISADHFWSPSPPPPSSATSQPPSIMNRSSSEWAFQRFLQEASSVAADGNDHSVPEQKDSYASSGTSAVTASSVPPVDSEEYQAFLKSKLDLACAAVATSRASFIKTQEAAGGPKIASKTSTALQLGSSSKGAANKDSNAPLGISPAHSLVKKVVVQNPVTSGSSLEQSEDDEVEGELEITENMDPADVKRVRRMLSNRESARRSRRRKQAHLTELETQVSQLQAENSGLLKRLTDISQKYNEAAVDNRVLKADVETLRAKVKMAEETVKRITGINPLHLAMSEISTVSMPSFSGSPSGSSTDHAASAQEEPKHQFHPGATNNPTSSHDPRSKNALADISSVENIQPNSGGAEAGAALKIGRTPSMQRVASLEHLQKRICGSDQPWDSV